MALENHGACEAYPARRAAARADYPAGFCAEGRGRHLQEGQRGLSGTNHRMPRPRAPPVLFGAHLEKRINPCLDRALVKNVRAESVYRSDARELKLSQRAVEPFTLLALRRKPRLLDLATKAQLHLACSLFCKCEGDDLAESARARSDKPHDPPDQLRCLAGSRRRLDKKRRAELARNPPPRIRVRKHRHERL